MEDRHLFKDLFKAKRKDNGEWVQGVPFEIEGKTVILISDNENILRVHYLEENMWEADIYAVEVDPTTICQCTGYEGIYEKDIFQCDDERYVIEWCDYSLYWEAQAIGSPESISLGEFGPDEIVVIGNAIDNPELLESEVN
mgnify:CR=1 FL=1